MKKRAFKGLLVLAVLILGTMALAGCAKPVSNSEDGFEAIKERGYVVVGLDDTFAPMGFRDANNEIVGFDVDMAKEVFNRMGLEVKFQQIDWAMKEAELNSGNIDFIWNGYTITDERKEKVAFTKPYLANRQIVITLADSEINTKADLADKIVATQTASSSYDAISSEPELMESFKNGEPVVFDTYNEAFMDLEAGRSQAVVADEVLARYYISERGEEKYKVLDEDFGKEEYGVGLRKQDAQLLVEVQKALDEMKKDGASAKISEKWFGEDIVK